MTLLSLPRVRPVGGVPDNRFPGDPAASGSPPLGSDPGEKVAAVTVEHFEISRCLGQGYPGIPLAR